MANVVGQERLDVFDGWYFRELGEHVSQVGIRDNSLALALAISEQRVAQAFGDCKFNCVTVHRPLALMMAEMGDEQNRDTGRHCGAGSQGGQAVQV